MKKILVSILFSILFLPVAHFAQATTYYLAKSGNNSNSCATATDAGDMTKAKLTLNGATGALSCLVSGDTLDIRTGTYREKIQEYIPYPLAFAPLGGGYGGGTSWTNAITIQGHTGETVTVGGIVFDGLSPNSMQYLIFKDLVVDNSLTGAEGVYVGKPGHHIRFQNVEMKNGYYHGYSGCAYCELLNSSIHDSQGYGAYIASHDNLLDHVDVYNNKNYGLHVYSANPLGLDPVNGDDVSNNTVRFSKVHDNASECIKCEAQGVTGLGGDGILISSGANNAAYGNLIWNNYNGLRLDYGCNGCIGVNNTIYGNADEGIRIAAGTSSILSNAIIRNNIVSSNGTNGIYVNGRHVSNLSNDHNLCDSAAATGCFQTGDPQFQDSSSNPPDLHLTARSTNAIGQGIDLASPYNLDYDGNVRPAGSAFDIGAYAYGGSPLPLTSSR